MAIEDGTAGDPATTSIVASGNAIIDGELSSAKWSTTNLTFSFPTSGAQYSATTYGSYNEHNNGFSAFDAGQQAAVAGFLQSIASFSGLTFTPTEEADGILRFAESNEPASRGFGAYAYYPSSATQGGDVWTNHVDYEAAKLTPGTYGWRSLQHEIGHALGLKHGHESGGAAAAPLPAEYDGHEYSIMTYKSYIGDASNDGYENEYGGHPQSMMMADIAALQYLYGANFGATANNTNTVYSFDANTGQMLINGVGGDMPAANRVFRTIWDGGGVDTYDFSNYGGGINIDLQAGGFSRFSDTQLADLGGGPNNGFARGNVFNALLYQGDYRSLIENAIGGAGDDSIMGNQVGNMLDGRGGADSMRGFGGNDKYLVDNAGDTVFEDFGGGVDQIISAALTYKLQASAEVETMTLKAGTSKANLTGNNFAQTINGSNGANVLIGLGGNDTIMGFDGKDFIHGGAGLDRLYGGLGDDLFVFNTKLDAVTNKDTIFDFKNDVGNNDTIQLENAIFTKLTTLGTLSEDFFRANTKGVATQGNDYVLYSTSTGAVLYDADGNGAGKAIQFATVAGGLTLGAADFFVI